MNALLLHQVYKGAKAYEIIDAGDYVDIIKHPSRPNQRMFVLRIDSYVWAVPDVAEGNEEESMFLKTAFPS